MATDQQLVALLGSESFLQMRGLNNEVPFFIYPFDPRTAVEAEKSLRKVETQLMSQGINVVTVDLFELCLRLLEGKGILERIVEAEAKQPKTKFSVGMQSMLDTESDLAPAIAGESADRDLVIVHNIGAVFPFVRTHALLEALQIHMPPIPLVLWFPGEYVQNEARGFELKVLDISASDSYYRAKNIEEMIKGGF